MLLAEMESDTEMQKALPATGRTARRPKPTDRAHDKIFKPGPKSRPGLVVKVGEIAGEPAVAVAFGTSQNVGELHSGGRLPA